MSYDETSEHHHLRDPARLHIVATTRPETRLWRPPPIQQVKPGRSLLQGPDAKHAGAPLVGRRIEDSFGDDYADETAGSGAVKITPAHDFNDFRGRQAASPQGDQHPDRGRQDHAQGQ